MVPEIRVGTYNLAQWSNDTVAGKALYEFLPHVDVAGLQEFGGGARRAYLDNMKGFQYFKPRTVPTAPPIIWNRDVFQYVHGWTSLVSHGRHVGFAAHKRSTLPDYYASIVTLEHKASGGKISVGNIHTPAHVQFWPGPRRTMYKESINGTIRVMDRTLPAFLVGDFNWSLDKRNSLPVKLAYKHGLNNVWKHIQPVGNTEGGRVIDGMFSNVLPSKAEIVHKINAGDHEPVVGTYPILRWAHA